MSELMRQLVSPQMQFFGMILLIMIIAIYLLSILWVGRDARLRDADPKKWSIIAIIPGAGIIAYLLLRPPMYAMDRDEQELEVALKQRELMTYGECAKCGYPVKNNYIVCPNCESRLRQQCVKCGQPLEPSWTICPYCATRASAENAGSFTSTSELHTRRHA